MPALPSHLTTLNIQPTPQRYYVEPRSEAASWRDLRGSSALQLLAHRGDGQVRGTAWGRWGKKNMDGLGTCIVLHARLGLHALFLAPSNHSGATWKPYTPATLTSLHIPHPPIAPPHHPPLVTPPSRSIPTRCSRWSTARCGTAGGGRREAVRRRRRPCRRPAARFRCGALWALRATWPSATWQW